MRYRKLHFWIYNKSKISQDMKSIISFGLTRVQYKTVTVFRNIEVLKMFFKIFLTTNFRIPVQMAHRRFGPSGGRHRHCITGLIILIFVLKIEILVYRRVTV